MNSKISLYSSICVLLVIFILVACAPLKQFSNEQHSNKDILYELGIAERFSKEKKYDQCIEILRNTTLKYPYLKKPFFLLAQCQKMNADYFAAIKSAKKAARLDPMYAEAYNLLGLIHLDMTNYKYARDYYDKAIEVNPNVLHAYHNRGYLKKNYFNDCFSALYDFEKEIVNLKAAGIRNHFFAQAHYGYIRCLIIRKENDLALSTAIDIANQYPKDGNLQALAGKTLSLFKRYEESLNYYLKTLSLNPNRPADINNVGLAYYYLENYDSAIQYYNQAIKVDANYAIAYNNRAQAFLKIGNEQSALVDFQSGCNLGRDFGCKMVKKLNASRNPPPSYNQYYQQPSTQTYSDDCCKYCRKGKACGDTCIARWKRCHVGVGCACNS